MLNIILLTAQPAGQGMMSIVMIVSLIAIFYFFMIRPQNKKQKEMRNFRNAMKQGDRVTTAGGIHGKVRTIKDNTILLEIAEGVKVEIDKSMVYPTAQEAAAGGVDMKK